MLAKFVITFILGMENFDHEVSGGPSSFENVISSVKFQ